jgi:hypothetical protein
MPKLRLAHPALYMRYFALALPKDQLSEAQLSSLTDLAQRDPFGFAEAVRTLMPNGPTGYFANRFFGWASTLQPWAEFQVARAMVKIWESFSAAATPEQIVSDQDRASFLVYDVLDKTTDRQERVERAIRLVQDSSLMGAVWVVGMCSRAIDGREPLLNAQELDDVRKYIFDRIDRLTDDQLMAEHPFALLTAMSEWGRQDAARAWANRLAGRRDGLVALVRDARYVERVYSSNQVRETVLVRRTELGKLLDLARTNERAQQYLESGVATPEDREALELYLTGPDVEGRNLLR